jgi:hypothetical protein
MCAWPTPSTTAGAASCATSSTRRARTTSGTLCGTGFDGVLSSCVFAWEERAGESCRFMRREIQRYLDKHIRPALHPLPT